MKAPYIATNSADALALRGDAGTQQDASRPEEDEKNPALQRVQVLFPAAKAHFRN
jgi:hypothetical protein